MTNTRITDPEVLERRFPVLLRTFAIRRGSGGKGKFRGGDGAVRIVQFLRPLTAGILSERRVLCPKGLKGGHNAKRGRNLLIRYLSRPYPSPPLQLIPLSILSYNGLH